MAQTKKARRLTPARKAARSIPQIQADLRAREERRQLLAGRKLQREIVSLSEALERAMRRADYRLMQLAGLIATRSLVAKRTEEELRAAADTARDESRRERTAAAAAAPMQEA